MGDIEIKFNKKVIVGIILLAIWGIYFIALILIGRGSEQLYLNISIIYLMYLFAIPGFLLLYYGLSYPERGIMLIIA